MSFSVVARYAQDPRVAVAAAQMLYLYFGIQSGFDVTWLKVSVAVGAAVTAELALSWILNRKVFFPLSAIPTALGIGMYFRSASPLFFALVALVAVGSKYVLKRKTGGHIFNPSNLGIVLLVFLAPSVATVEFTQWGASLPVYCLVAAVSLLVAYWARVLSLSLSFLVSYFFFLELLLPYLPDIFSVHHYGLLGPSLVVFSTLMITDPKTIPQSIRGRINQGIIAAALFFLFELWGIRYSLFLAIPAAVVLNLFSEYISVYLARAGLNLKTKNTLTLGGVCIVWIIAFVFVILPHPAQFGRASISPDFLLRGVESGQLLRTPRNPVFVPSARANFAGGADTYGAAWGDYDADGYDDLFVSSANATSSALYRNNKDGTFTDVTAKMGLPRLHSFSAYFADYNDDGRLDLFILSAEGVAVYRNDDALFIDATERSGLSVAAFSTQGGSAISFADYDRDGDLDFVLANAGKIIPELEGANWSEAMHKSFTDPFFNRSIRLVCDLDTAKEYLSGHDYFGQSSAARTATDATLEQGGCLDIYGPIDILAHRPSMSVFGISDPPAFARLRIPGSVHVFENRRGVFSEHASFKDLLAGIHARSKDVTRRYGMSDYDFISGRYFQPISFDYDGDGFADILLTLDSGSVRLLKNNGGFAFSDVTAEAGFDYSGAPMGVAVGDYTHDGRWDAVVTSINGALLASFDTGRTGIKNAPNLDRLGVGWGVAFVDYNLDGWDDLFITNGDTEQRSTLDFQLSRSFFRLDNLYRNDFGTLVNVSGVDVPPDMQSGRALAVADFDNNGTPDVFVGNRLISPDPTGQLSRSTLYVNTSEGNSFLKVKLMGSTDNSFGIGAEVTVTAGGLVQKKIVFAGDSFYSQSSSRLVFGLGTSTAPVDVRVLWPSGKIQTLSGVSLNQELTVRQR